MIFKYAKSKFPKHKYMVPINMNTILNHFGIQGGWGPKFVNWMNLENFGTGEVYPIERNDKLAWFFDKFSFRVCWSANAYIVWFQDLEAANNFNNSSFAIISDYEKEEVNRWFEAHCKKWELIKN